MLKSDLKDAYYYMKVLEKLTKQLQLLAGSKLLKFVVLPNGLTKTHKNSQSPLFVVLRLKGIIATYKTHLII